MGKWMIDVKDQQSPKEIRKVLKEFDQKMCLKEIWC